MEAAGEPLVSVIIPYYKRSETIAETLNSVLKQDYHASEIIVVDDHSEDDLSKIAAGLSREIQIVEMPSNQGACAARNAGIAASKGEVLVFLEDDVSFLSKSEISKIVRIFQDRPAYHVLSLKICDPDTGELRLREWCHPRYWKKYSEEEFETLWFGEGASAFRREVFKNCGCYFEPFFYGAEGDDLVIRIFNSGYRILYVPQIRVGHRSSDKGRTSHRQYYFFTRNYVWTAYKNYHFILALRYLFSKLAMMFYFAARTGSVASVLKGLRDGFKGLPALKPYRAVATKDTIRYMSQLERLRPGIWTRLARHRLTPQI
ncbi:MAG TPA: glycosyltransferase family 2 protein [Candidatus Acidoferrales bacterium]|nr:glycosyltransferase family 2 protein [Candidatus Acidoferrales bacterium]